MATDNRLQPKPSRRRLAGPTVDPRDDFWGRFLRHRERLQTFRRPVKAPEATRDRFEKFRDTAG